jgi:hypothetical protein
MQEMLGMKLWLKRQLSRYLNYNTHDYMLDIFQLNKAMCIGYFREIPYLELSKLYLIKKE